MNLKITTFFVIAQMAGVGFLALPNAFALTGWIGVPLLAIFAFSVGYSSIKLGQCWVILEQRWPQYRGPVREPYMEIAYRAFGSKGRRLVQGAVLITLIGSAIVILILVAEFFNSLIPSVTKCTFILIMSAVLIPFTWLGTPKDFWVAPILATMGVLVSCTVIVAQLLVDIGDDYFPQDPIYENPTIKSFSLGFASILFAFGGASVFPTLQNDMKDKTQFWKCLIVAFTYIFLLYFPVASCGYAFMGTEVSDNILLYRGQDLSIALKIAVAFELINLLATFLIVLSPVFQSFEEILDIPRHFGIKRGIFRTILTLIITITALALPEFGYILNLVGGSTITLCSFLAPSLMYFLLVDAKLEEGWPKWHIPLWERVFLYEIIGVAFVGGICATSSAIIEIVTADFSQSCFTSLES